MNTAFEKIKSNPDGLQISCNCTVKKKEKIFHIYKEIQKGSGAKSYMRKGFLIYEEMRQYLVIYDDANAISHN
jgi:hypothetical protein